MFFAALAGLAFFFPLAISAYTHISNNNEQERYQPYRYTEEPSGFETLPSRPTVAKPFKYRTPCREPRGESESDLCAEWKSAIASEDSAFWAKWGVLIAGIGSALLLWQIVLTRRAVEENSAATEAMHEANRLTQANSELEYRPIMIFSHFIIEPGAGINNIYVTPVWKNIGRLPALPIVNDTYRVYVQGRINGGHVAEMLETDTPHSAAEFTIIPSEGECRGGLKIVTSNEVGLRDYQRGLPQGVPEEAKAYFSDGLDRFFGENFALFLFRIRYKAALGHSRQEFITERCIGIMPAFDETRHIRTDKFYTTFIDGYPLETVS